MSLIQSDQVQVFERLKSPQRQSGTSTNQKHKFFVTGADDIATAELAVYAFADEFVTMMNGQELPLNLIETEVSGVDPNGNLLIEGSVTYGPDPNANGKQPTFQFKTSGGTQKITSSISTLGSYTASGKAAPVNNGSINATKDGVDGVDIVVPVLSWTEKHYLPTSLLTPQYIFTLATLTGHTNLAPFRAFGPGQVLFMGANGGNDATTLAEITFEFQGSPDQADLTIGGIEGIQKPGWAYLWVSYQDGVSNGFAVKTPTAVYIEQVYTPADFTGLGIPQGQSL